MMSTVPWLADAASTADWTAAIGQCIGAIGTAAGVYAALRVAARERSDDRAAPARRVSVRTYGSGERRIVVHNRSETSIVEVELMRRDGSSFQPDPDDGWSWEEIAPGTHRDVAVSDDVEPTVTFTDGAGRRWRRRGSSAPTPVRS